MTDWVIFCYGRRSYALQNGLQCSWPLPAVTTKDVSRHCQMPLGKQYYTTGRLTGLTCPWPLDSRNELTHLVAFSSSLLIFSALLFHHCVYIPQSIHSTDDGHLSSLQLEAIMHNATVNIPNVSSSEYMYVSVECLDPELLVVWSTYVSLSRLVLFLRGFINLHFYLSLFSCWQLIRKINI